MSVPLARPAVARLRRATRGISAGVPAAVVGGFLAAVSLWRWQGR
jgi:hypothetical protein